jgi:hypothetical protein
LLVGLVICVVAAAPTENPALGQLAEGKQVEGREAEGRFFGINTGFGYGNRYPIYGYPGYGYPGYGFGYPGFSGYGGFGGFPHHHHHHGYYGYPFGFGFGR